MPLATIIAADDYFDDDKRLRMQNSWGTSQYFVATDTTTWLSRSAEDDCYSCSAEHGKYYILKSTAVP